MQATKYQSKNNHRITIGMLIFILLISSIFLMSACNTINEPAEEAGPPVNETTGQEPATSQPVDHNVDMNPDSLTASDKALTLEGYGAKGAIADKNLSVYDMLMYAVEDEYLAHGEYSAIINKFGSQKPYENIILAEETHLAYLKEIYFSYDLEFPNDSSADHVVIPTDLLEAAKTGVQAEIDNIAMYELFLTYDLPENVYEVFSALKSGSDSHLLSFQKQVERLSK
ncbi:MAG: DUF2202 domain-containing protein [Peptostreptococcaceae bacterium]|nr:DUF2202 domain-containing protein [Peptostreptococcaceae bacterium]